MSQGFDDKHKYFEVEGGMIFRDDEEDFNLDELFTLLEENGYAFGGSFRGMSEEDYESEE